MHLNEIDYTYLIKSAKQEGIHNYSVGAFILNADNELMVLRRKIDDFMGGLWEMPSGGIEKEENIEEALKREIKEESDLEMLEVKSYVNYFDYLCDSTLFRQWHFFVKTNDISNAKISDEHDMMEWYKPNGKFANIIDLKMQSVLIDFYCMQKIK
ncbi:MAG: NUDIX domain-containing protein [Proteobacteria bacterium]|nr:NUDIX domain-containing protein [Pseudomonadota bacterium]